MPPGQCLESNFQAALGRAFAKFAEIGCRAIDAAARFRRDVAAHQQRGATELLHQIELSLGAIEGAPPLRIRHALEVAKRLERDQGQAKIRDLFGDFDWRAGIGQQIVFQDLDAAKACGGNRLQLLA